MNIISTSPILIKRFIRFLLKTLKSNIHYTSPILTGNNNNNNQIVRITGGNNNNIIQSTGNTTITNSDKRTKLVEKIEMIRLLKRQLKYKDHNSDDPFYFDEWMELHGQSVDLREELKELDEKERHAK